jgi:hypothetical protein
MSEADLRTVAELLRDRSLAMAMRYAHLAQTIGWLRSNPWASLLPSNEQPPERPPAFQAFRLLEWTQCNNLQIGRDLGMVGAA